MTHRASDAQQRRLLLRLLALVLDNELVVNDALADLSPSFVEPDLYLFRAYICGAAAAERDLLPRVHAAELRSMPYREYLQTPEWASRREAQLELDDYRCRTCNGGDGLQVHHRTYQNRGDEQPGDLITLCADCHRTFHANRQLDKQRTYA